MNAGFPTYHLASVVDDHEMGITHIVRGEEWISSTPKHVLLYQWFGVEPPKFAHMPLLRNADKSKISKRKNPAARLTWFREQGYLPEALRNFLALMGYSLPDGREIFSFEELVESFDWQRVNVVGPVFDLDKLGWLNGHYIRDLPVEELADRVVEHLVFREVLPATPTDEQVRLVRAITPHIQERMNLLDEAVGMVGFLLTPDGRPPAGGRRGRCAGRDGAGDARGGVHRAGESRHLGRHVDRVPAARLGGRWSRPQAQGRVHADPGGRDRTPDLATPLRVHRGPRPGRDARPPAGAERPARWLTPRVWDPCGGSGRVTRRPKQGRTPLGYGVLGSPADSGSASLGSSPGTPAHDRFRCSTNGIAAVGYLHGWLGPRCVAA